MVEWLQGAWQGITGAGISVGLIVFLVLKIQRLVKEVGEFVEHVKAVGAKVQKGKVPSKDDITKLLKESDDVLEVLAKIAGRVGQRKLAQKLRDVIQL